MRTAVLIALSGFLLRPALAQPPQPTAAELEAMEKYASRPTAQPVWSKEAGRVETRLSRAVITTVILKDETQTPLQMKGVRIELATEGRKDQVYTSEAHIPRLMQALDEILSGLPHASRTARSCFGSGIFWQQQGHAFSASQCTMPEWSGLDVHTGAESFRFPDVTPSAFVTPIAIAAEELRRH